MSRAPPAASSSGATRKIFATARYGFSRPRPFSSASSISPAFTSMRTWKCRWPGSTPSRWASSRFVSLRSPSAPSLSSTRVSCKTSCPLGLSSGALLHIEAGLSSPEPGCSSTIEDCSGSAAVRADEARRRVGARRCRKSSACGLRLLGTGESEDDLARAVQGEDAQRNPVDKGFQPGLRRKNSLALLQCRRVREQGRDVTVLADPEQLEVEHGLAELLLVRSRSFVLPELAHDAVHCAGFMLEPVEQCVFSKRIVRKVVVGGN